MPSHSMMIVIHPLLRCVGIVCRLLRDLGFVGRAQPLSIDLGLGLASNLLTIAGTRRPVSAPSRNPPVAAGRSG